jgi:hypothetical protein
MTAVTGRIVGDQQMRGRQCFHKFTFDFLGNRACHVFPFAWADTMCNRVKHDKFHGRVSGNGRLCNAPGCEDSGEFRAPGVRPSGFDGPGDYRWFCLDHIRAFNAGYDFFAGMSQDEIWPRNRRSPAGKTARARFAPMPGSTRPRAGPILPIRSKPLPAAPAPARPTTLRRRKPPGAESRPKTARPMKR